MIPDRTAARMNAPRHSSFPEIAEGYRLYIRNKMAMKVNKNSRVLKIILEKWKIDHATTSHIP